MKSLYTFFVLPTLYVLTKEKIILPKQFFLKIHQVKKLPENSKNKTPCWVLTDTLVGISQATKNKCKSILLANGAEKKWHITPDRYPTFITASFEQALNFFQLLL